MSIKAVIFDLFGTLIANYDRLHYYEVIERMGEAVGANPIEFRTRWRDCYVERLTGVFTDESENIRWVCEQMGIGATPASIERSNRVYLEFALPFLMAPRTSAVKMLGELRARGIKTGLLSDCGPWVPSNWEDSPFSVLIDYPVYSSLSGAKKPDPTLYESAAGGLGATPKECMYVADGNGEELVIARQLGMRAVKIEPWNEPGSAPDADYSNQWDGESVDALSELFEKLD